MSALCSVALAEANGVEASQFAVVALTQFAAPATNQNEVGRAFNQDSLTYFFLIGCSHAELGSLHSSDKMSDEMK